MPFPPPFSSPPELFTDQWDKLGHAWRGFNPSEKDIFINDVVRDLRYQGKLKNLPDIPDWDRIVKLGPLAPELTPEEQAARRAQMGRQILTSPVPREVQALGSLANVFDDVQDLAVFIALVGRLALAVLPQSAVFLVGGLVTLDRAAVGINALTALVNAVAIGAGLRSAAALGAAAQVVGSNALRIMLKNELVRLLRLAARKGVGLTPVRGAFEKIVRKGDILQSLQATDTLFGVGISLGAIMGYFLNLAYGVVDLISGPRAPATVEALKEIEKTIPAEWIILKEFSQRTLQF